MNLMIDSKAVFKILDKDKQLVFQTKRLDCLKEILSKEDEKGVKELYKELTSKKSSFISIDEVINGDGGKTVVEFYPFKLLVRDVNKAINKVNSLRKPGRNITPLELPPIDEIESAYFFEKKGSYYFRIHYKEFTRNLFTLTPNEVNIEVINNLKKLWISLKKYICEPEIRKGKGDTTDTTDKHICVFES